MFKKLVVAMVLVGSALVGGCASVPMASAEKDSQAKSFAATPGKSNIYIYRNESMGAAIKMPVVLDGMAIGDTAAKTYLFVQAAPGKHTLVSKAENDFTLDLSTEAGKNYFVWQEVKMGLMTARSKLQVVDDAAGRAGVAECKLAETRQ